MQIIENEVISGKTVTVDEKHFVNCKYRNCTVLYSGGDFGWTNTTFENCQFSLLGPALKTASFLAFTGVIKQPMTMTNQSAPKPSGPPVQ